jgi:hypothetical protein
MTPEQIFPVLNAVAALAWIVLAVVPRRRWATVTVATAVPLLLAIAYTILIAAAWGGSEGGFSSLGDVALLFQNRWLLLAGWVHYLAFDLLVGGWEVRDAAERRIPHLAVVPCLALTFMFGPAGWLLYLALRWGFAVMNRGGRRETQSV